MTTANPFTGMNPFYEQQWRDAHTRLLTYLHDALQENLPADLIARTEEEVVTEEIDRWIEIRDTAGRLVTVLELLSPSNKLESADRDRYLRKRRSFISGGANFAEIDLVRQGNSVFPQEIRRLLQEKAACYGVCVFRAERPVEREVYPIPVRERLPAIRVPLRPTDADVVLDLQPLIDQCHERGRYHLLDYRLNPDPPLSPEDAAWVDEILRHYHLR